MRSEKGGVPGDCFDMCWFVEKGDFPTVPYRVVSQLVSQSDNQSDNQSV